jgi:hypothetical protein
MGGIGKTELVLQYVIEYLKNNTDPGGVCWLKGGEDLGIQIINFAYTYLDLIPPAELEQIAERVQWCWQKWQQQGEKTVLIVIDNASNYGSIESFLPPSPSRFWILLTSRTKFTHPVENHEIKVLGEAAALRLLGSFEPHAAERVGQALDTAKQICQWLGYLPLGLELVARYLANKPDLTIAKLWERLEAKKLAAKSLLAAAAEMTADWGVIAAFELSWQELDSAERELAALLSLFALADIPWQLVAACLADGEEEELEDARDKLCDASLLTRTGENIYELHQLLREFFALKLQELPQREEFITNFATVLTQVAKTVPQTVTLDRQAELTLYLPHLTAATEFANYLPDDDKTWCCTSLARYYQSQSLFTTAENWYRTALAIREEQLGANHPTTATSLNNLAELYRVMGRYPAAEPLYVRSLAIREEQLGANHPDTATSLNNLALLYESMGRYPAAEPLYVRSIEIVAASLGDEHPNTQTILNNFIYLIQTAIEFDRVDEFSDHPLTQHIIASLT